MIPQRKLGRTTLSVSALGLGTTEIGYVYGIGNRSLPTDQEAIDLLHHAVDLGITFIDTGHFYGEAERRIGESGVTQRRGQRDYVAIDCFALELGRQRAAQ